MDLIEFLWSRLDEDEAVAREAEGLHWRTGKPYFGSVDVEDAELHRSVIMDREGGSMSEETGAHVARWDPARVLAEVEAKRAVIRALASGAPQSYDAFRATGVVVAAALRALAAPYADHPKFDPAWRTQPVKQHPLSGSGSGAGCR